MNETQEFLLSWSKEIRSRIGPNDPGTAYLIDAAIRSAASDVNAPVNNRRVACLFSTANLLYTGAVVEAAIARCIADNEDRDFRPPQAPLLTDQQEAFEHLVGWRGDSIGGARNLVGRISFMTSLLFFFEGLAKIVATEERIRIETRPAGMEKNENGRRRIEATAVADWLKAAGIVPDKEQRRSIHFLVNYRNAWHSFGIYAGSECHALGRELRLVPGQVLPVLAPPNGLTVLGHLLDAMVKLDEWFWSQSH